MISTGLGDPAGDGDEIVSTFGTAVLATYAEATKEKAKAPKAVTIPEPGGIVNYLAKRIAVATRHLAALTQLLSMAPRKMS